MDNTKGASNEVPLIYGVDIPVTKATAEPGQNINPEPPNVVLRNFTPAEAAALAKGAFNVEQLRERCACFKPSYLEPETCLYCEAADEIERLRGAMNYAVRCEQEWKAALVRYGHHAGSCLSGPTCYCGWEELAKKMEGAK